MSLHGALQVGRGRQVGAAESGQLRHRTDVPAQALRVPRRDPLLQIRASLKQGRIRRKCQVRVGQYAMIREVVSTNIHDKREKNPSGVFHEDFSRIWSEYYVFC